MTDKAGEQSAALQTLPCGCEWTRTEQDSKGPIYWNPFNQVAQCHMCGQQYSVAEASTAEQPPEPRWISVKDRLPDGDAVWVLAYCPKPDDLDPSIVAAFIDGRGKWEGEMQRLDDVTHWMPLPKPPESASVGESPAPAAPPLDPCTAQLQADWKAKKAEFERVAAPPEPATDVLESLMKLAIRLAIMRFNLEEDGEMSEERAEDIAKDATWACQGEGTCDESPLPEWTKAVETLESVAALQAKVSTLEQALRTAKDMIEEFQLLLDGMGFTRKDQEDILTTEASRRARLSGESRQ